MLTFNSQFIGQQITLEYIQVCLVICNIPTYIIYLFKSSRHLRIEFIKSTSFIAAKRTSFLHSPWIYRALSIPIKRIPHLHDSNFLFRGLNNDLRHTRQFYFISPSLLYHQLMTSEINPAQCQLNTILSILLVN